MPRVLVGGKLHPSGLKILQEHPDIDLDYVEAISTESLVPNIYSADALLLRTQPLPRDIINESPGLKIVSRHGVGYDAVDVEALNQRRIPLAIVGDVTTIAVAEHTLMLMLNLAKRLSQYDSATRGAHESRQWGYRNSLEATELHGKTILIAGFGRIGRRVAHLANAFGMSVMVHDLLLEPASLPPDVIACTNGLADAVQTADFITVHVPGSDQPLIGSRELALMKPSAIVINTARGGVVDEAALVTALETGQIGGAGLDVFESEPLAGNSPLTAMEDTVVTPHSAAMTQECAERMAVVSARNIVDYFAGTLNPALVVNAENADITPES